MVQECKAPGIIEFNAPNLAFRIKFHLFSIGTSRNRFIITPLVLLVIIAALRSLTISRNIYGICPARVWTLFGKTTK
jgi:hypothetical protein